MRVSCSWTDSFLGYAGEEHKHGDPHNLIETAAVIEPIADVLRRALERSQVAILSARAHGADWLSKRLEKKLNLPRRPDFIECVYSPDFENNVCDGPTPDRKALALERLVERSKAQKVHFYDDVQENLDKAKTHFVDTKLQIYTYFVDFDYSLRALADLGLDPKDIFDPQLRHERNGEPNELCVEIRDQLGKKNPKAFCSCEDVDKVTKDVNFIDKVNKDLNFIFPSDVFRQDEDQENNKDQGNLHHGTRPDAMPSQRRPRLLLHDGPP